MKLPFPLISTLAFTQLVHAWPWTPFSQDLLERDLLRRQSGDEKNSASASSGATASSGAPTSTANSASGPNTNTPATTAAPTSGNSNSDANSTAGVSVPQTAGVGAINLISPALTAASQYYKVDQTVTWIWNYTNLLVTPTAIDILATVSPLSGIAAPTPFTLATNQSFEATQTFTWDTGAYTSASGQLPIGTYTLIVYDADQPGYTAGPSRGHLGTWEQFRFGLYTGAPNTTLANPYVCATCNAAVSRTNGLTVKAVIVVASITVGSFYWFAGSFGAI